MRAALNNTEGPTVPPCGDQAAAAPVISFFFIGTVKVIKVIAADYITD